MPVVSVAASSWRAELSSPLEPLGPQSPNYLQQEKVSCLCEGPRMKRQLFLALHQAAGDENVKQHHVEGGGDEDPLYTVKEAQATNSASS